MIEVTGNDIKDLSDIDLRSLIGLLCEAELRENNIPTAGVTWGGHQNARDGGIDVRVEIAATLTKDNYIPNSKTVFQVKKPDMPRAEIINEMRPNGELREVIRKLINDGGAYIIVSSQGSTADSALEHRKDAMREAIADCPNASNATLDFYDRERIAGWVRSHPSIVLWVRDKVGKALQGWKMYGNWSNCPNGTAEEYILDGHVRLYNSTNPHSEAFSAVDGINKVREILHRPSTSVRLVGLSGVGKTRFLQALFDERIGAKPLNQSQVFYTDISDSPDPDPRNFGERLIALRRPAILAVDNCPPDLHRNLTSVCSASSSQINLITVEYDVRDDQPEETEVFRLEPASSELIEKVIHMRFEHVSQVDTRTIAEFSGGNARIAIALAKTLEKNENLANLRDEELFVRLFKQRNESNSDLLKVAEVCSLVYSFDCQTAEGTNTELRLLGSLISMSARELYQSVSELKRRELIQKRSTWRAVMPHAIANRLAKRALENIPLDDIYNVFEDGNAKRLLKSFSKRIGYLHECKEAIEVSTRWLSEGGLLGEVSELDNHSISLFENIAPIKPELALAAIERVLKRENANEFFSRRNPYYINFSRLLRSIAYDRELFIRAVNLLCLFALTERQDENNNSIRYKLKSLFYIYLSGTHATPEQRLKIIENLVEADDDVRCQLGIELLGASLEAWHFSSSHNFEFGARSRDYGYTPKNREEICRWYKLSIEYASSLATSDLPVASKAKSILAEKFRGLWIKAYVYAELDLAARKISSKTTWNEGWVAVRNTKRFDGERMSPDVLEILNSLDVLLKPVTLMDKVRLYAFSGRWSILDLDDTLEPQNDNGDTDYFRIEKTTRTLGSEVGANEEIFEELLVELLSGDGTRLFSFGQGLYDGCADPKKMWRDFCKQLSFLEEPSRNFGVLCGFLNAISQKDITISEELLSEAVSDEILASAFPLLQSNVKFTARSFERIKSSLEHGVAPLWYYRNLAYRGDNLVISDNEWCEMLRLISSKTEGHPVALEILHIMIQAYSDGKHLSSNIIILGQELLLRYKFSRKGNQGNMTDYQLSKIIEACFDGESAKQNATILCSRIAKAFANYDFHTMDYNYVLKALATKQPLALLDAFLLAKINSSQRLCRRLSEDGIPISGINVDIIKKWSETNPLMRYPLVASAILPFKNNEDGDLLEWTPLALEMINNFSDPIIILNEFKSALRPMMWSGSRAEIMQKRLRLISDLKKHENSLIASWAREEEKVFTEEILSERKWELKSASDQNERFEY